MDKTERLKYDLKRLDAELNPPRFDPNDPIAMKKKLKEMDDLFSFRLNAFRDELRRNGDSGHDNNWEYLVLKRRKQAIQNLFIEAESRFADKYPELCVSDELMRFNAPLATMTFQTLNKEYYVELAAAIWILDYLKDTKQIEEAKRYFPTTREELNSIYLPLISDSIHSDDELKSMIYLIQFRNRGRNGFDENKAFCDEADTRLKKDNKNEDSQDRKNFDAIIAMIDKELIKLTQNNIIEHIWAFFDSLLSIIANLKHEQIVRKKILRRELVTQINNYEKDQIKKPTPLSFGTNKDILQDLIKDNSTPSMSEISKMLQNLAKLGEEIKKGDASIESTYYLLMLIPGWVKGDLPADCNMDYYNELIIPTIQNPYYDCFAYLTLLDENSDYVWLYNICYNVLAFACHALPWADSMVVDPDGDAGELRVDYEYLRSLIEKHPDWDEDVANEKLYELSVPSPLLNEKRVQTSIAKLTFLSSGLIPPRTSEAVSFTKALLAETDYSLETQRMIYNYIALAYSVNHKDSDFQTLDDNQIAEELSQEKEESKDQDAEIKKLRAEIKHLKNLVNQIEHQKKDLSSELSESQRKLESSNSELAELRSMIRDACDTGDSTPTTVEFPYTATKRTVIIGGHESWVKAIKPLLNNVRFISSSEQPNSGVILNSEVVWIQSNAIGHSSFYKIIDIIRKHDIKVCYFKYASAEKCAEQLALEEIENDQ